MVLLTYIPTVGIRLYISTVGAHLVRIPTVGIWILLAGNRQTLLFHFKACPDERTDALAIVVTDWLRHIILETSVTTLVDLVLRNIRRIITRTKTADLATMGEADGLIRINLDEVLDNSVVCLDTCVLIVCIKITKTITLQEAVGEHAACCCLKIILWILDIEDIIPQTGLLVLALNECCHCFLEQVDDLGTAGIV